MMNIKEEFNELITNIKYNKESLYSKEEQIFNDVIDIFKRTFNPEWANSDRKSLDEYNWYKKWLALSWIDISDMEHWLFDYYAIFEWWYTSMIKHYQTQGTIRNLKKYYDGGLFQ